MNEIEFVAKSINSWEKGVKFIEGLYSVAKTDAVYSPPVTAGDYTVITASEVSACLGFGYGAGAGNDHEMLEGSSAPVTDSGMGSGGGGGGTSIGRPVAVISVGPDGVQMEPVVDATKIALAFFTMLGSMIIMLNKMRNVSRKLG